MKRGPLRPELPPEVRIAAERLADEAPRKAIHLTSIVIPLGILHLPLPVAQRGLLLAGALFLAVDLMRLHHPGLRAVFGRLFGRLIRRHEGNDLLAATYMLGSAFLATVLFPREIAAAAYIYLVVGDTVAALVGKAWGRTRVFGKTLEGFGAGLVASFVAAALLVPGIPASTLAFGALCAAVVELLPIPVDDNFRIPLLSGVVLQWLR